MKTPPLQFLLPTPSTLDWTSTKLSLSSGSSSSSISLLSSSLKFSQPGKWEHLTFWTWFSMLFRTPTFRSLTETGMLMMEQSRNTEEDSEQLWSRSTVWWRSTSSSTLFCWGQWSTLVRALWYNVLYQQWHTYFSDADISSSHCVAGLNRTKTGGGGLLRQSCLALLAVHHLIHGQLSPGTSLQSPLQLLREILHHFL